MAGLTSAALLGRRRGVLGWLSFALAVLVAAGPRTATAQRPPISIPVVPAVGSRVRVTSPDLDGTIEGRVQELRGDTMVIATPGAAAPVLLRAADASLIEVNTRGQGGDEAALVGGTLGLLTGTAVWLKWCRDDPAGCARDAQPRCTDETCTDTTAYTVATLLVLGGAVVGALTAYALTPPRWEVLGAPARVALAPARGPGLRLGLSLSFFARPARRVLGFRLR